MLIVLLDTICYYPAAFKGGKFFRREELTMKKEMIVLDAGIDINGNDIEGICCDTMFLPFF